MVVEVLRDAVGGCADNGLAAGIVRPDMVFLYQMTRQNASNSHILRVPTVLSISSAWLTGTLTRTQSLAGERERLSS